MPNFLLTDNRTGEVVFDGSRISRSLRCPICDHDSWCLYDRERGLAICPRTEGNRKIGDAGWMHSIANQPLPSSRIEFSKAPDILEPLEGAFEMQEKFGKAAADRLPLLAFDLGVSIESLLYLQTGWNGLWTFPMRNAAGRIVGFRTRTLDGRKYAIKGSRSGLFIPACASRESRHVYVVEGVSDVAAMIDLGLNAIGRPSCRGCEQEVAGWVRGTDVTVIADEDKAGICGALDLVRTLRGTARSVQMILPPEGMKDVREAMNHGMTATDLISTARRYDTQRSSNGLRA